MFIAYARQDDEGCGHTIGCAQRLWRLKSTTRDEAIEELRRKIIGEWLPDYGEYEEGYDEEFRLREVVLFEVVNEEKIPLDRWYTKAENRTRQAKKKIDEDRILELADRIKRTRPHTREKRIANKHE